jgi:hypothetical protein
VIRSRTHSEQDRGRRSQVDDTKFDSIARMYGAGASRRNLLKGIFGLGGGMVAAVALSGGTDAARRGYGGPSGPGVPNDLQICPALGCCAMCSPYLPVIGQFVTCVQQQGLACQYCADHAGGCRLI